MIRMVFFVSFSRLNAISLDHPSVCSETHREILKLEKIAIGLQQTGLSAGRHRINHECREGGDPRAWKAQDHIVRSYGAFHFLKNL
jgi:hypothetical protein